MTMMDPTPSTITAAMATFQVGVSTIQRRNVLLLLVLVVVCLMTMTRTSCNAFTTASTTNHHQRQRTCSSSSSSSSYSPFSISTKSSHERMSYTSKLNAKIRRNEKSFFGRQLEELAKKKGISLDGTEIQKPTSSTASLSSSESSSSDQPKPKPKYQRIEDWEHENKLRRANGTMSWEEKVQFDGLQHGNQVRQNEILQKFLR